MNLEKPENFEDKIDNSRDQRRQLRDALIRAKGEGNKEKIAELEQAIFDEDEYQAKLEDRSGSDK